MDAQNHTVLVTGGAGYVGSHTCKALAEAGFRPVTLDNLVNGHRWAVKWGPLEEADLLDADRLAEVLSRHRPLAVLHFAAFAYVGESVADPAKYYRNNVVGTLNLLSAMRPLGVERLVFSSSCATYGVPEALPITEDTALAPINPYGATKMMVERVLADYRTAYGLRSVSLRYFNAAGADRAGEIGEDHDPETHLIPLVLDAAAGRRPRVTVFGNDHPTRDGTCVRDYIHVSDLAEAHVLALQALLSGSPRAAYNLGTGKGVSVAEVIATAQRLTGRRIPVEVGAARAGDPPTLVADPTLASLDLGFTARSSAIDDIVATAWAWHQSRTPASAAAAGQDTSSL